MNDATEQKSNKRLVACFEWVSILMSSLIASIVIFSLLFCVVTVSGDSMLNTLHSNDRVILVTQLYKLERGDIIVVARPGEDMVIKRVIALEGDTLDIDENGVVYLNGKTLHEDYVPGGITPAFDFKGPYTVKKGEVFAMGDNRQVSYDCREVGPFLIDDIAGEAVFRLFPLDAIGMI